MERTGSRGRKRPRQERSRFTVEAILIATERVLAEHGVQGATTNRIAEVAGVSIGSLYQYFPNKDAILVELVEDQRVERVHAVVGRGGAGRGPLGGGDQMRPFLVGPESRERVIGSRSARPS